MSLHTKLRAATVCIKISSLAKIHDFFFNTMLGNRRHGIKIFPWSHISPIAELLLMISVKEISKFVDCFFQHTHFR